MHAFTPAGQVIFNRLTIAYAKGSLGSLIKNRWLLMLLAPGIISGSLRLLSGWSVGGYIMGSDRPRWLHPLEVGLLEAAIHECEREGVEGEARKMTPEVSCHSLMVTVSNHRFRPD